MGPSDDAAAHAECIRRDGYSIIPNVLDEASLDAVREDLARLERELAIGTGDNIFEGLKTVRIYNLLARGPLYAVVATHERVLPVVEQVLDRGCLVSSASSIAIDPGDVVQPLHADDQLIPLPRPHVPIVCNTMWAITDFTAENGAARVVPSSHTRDRAPELGEAVAIIPAEMRRGDVLVYNGSLSHGGGANGSRTAARGSP